jgi:diketogulonate reductase-like aldo/keto reductase
LPIQSAFFDFPLTDEEMAQIAQLDRGERAGLNPANFNFQPLLEKLVKNA